jgi:hypothetical protein
VYAFHVPLNVAHINAMLHVATLQVITPSSLVNGLFIVMIMDKAKELAIIHGKIGRVNMSN